MTPTYLSIPERALSRVLVHYLKFTWSASENFFLLKVTVFITSLSKLIWLLYRVVVKIRVRVCKVPSIIPST